MTQIDTLSTRLPAPHVQSIARRTLVAPGVYRIATGISNAYIIELGQGEYVLVDAGPRHFEKKVLRACQFLFDDLPPRAIILTHGHADHAGGLPGLLHHWPDVPVYAHTLELPYLNEGVPYPPGDPTVGGAMAEMSRLTDSSQPTPLPVRVVSLPDEAGEFHLMPGWHLRPSPGHTPGHISLWNQNDRILVAGDALATMNPNNPLAMLSGRATISVPPPFATYNWHHTRQSARALAELEPLYLCCGHGNPMHGSQVAPAFHHFAQHFPIPRRGRYVHTPARFNRNGPTFIPPQPPDYVKQVVYTGAALAACIGIYRLLRLRSAQNDPQKQ